MRKSRIFILSGAVHAGKTTFVRRLCRELQKNLLQVNGILSLAHFSGDEHQGYDALIIQTDATFPLARLQGDPIWAKAGLYFFTPEGMTKAVQAILDFEKTALTVIDEIGPLELQGKGFWSALETLRKNDQTALIVVREGLVEPLCEKLSEKAVIFHLHQDDLLKRMTTALIPLKK